MKSERLFQLVRNLCIVLMLYNESFAYKRLKFSFSRETDQEYQLAIIADPQITDAYSYRQKSGFLLYMTEFYSDIYMKRCFNAFKDVVDSILFLGDLMDGGREWKSKQFQLEFQRFQRLFYTTNTDVYYVAGNHDIGFGSTTVVGVIEDFKRNTKQDLNYSVKLPHSYVLVVVNTMALEVDDSIKELKDYKNDAMQFIKSFSNHTKEKIILVSHVPLYRPPRTKCGGQRTTSQSIEQHKGYQYQNLISQANTDFVFSYIKPEIVLSGDDHDFCQIKHPHGVVEVTVPTFSWLQGNDYPGMGLMRLNEGGLKLNVIRLPNQKLFYHSYVSIAIAFILVGIFTREYKKILIYIGQCLVVYAVFLLF
ncbi:hypothetical protein O9G_005272 [Rozella allomycis CSF55]|uniref:Calcineurin-like phosphoesterase domain-containing protein n=1 Tax=Rozella allomycis (strain CSF55) TaxID=988480 RepID=A0A075B2M7_ROZAC|nr:hypothetical protein O9G_005272 [Rozella allomycis CSF55]|eukprot:EPZ36855.1 hypothetical protein O9G_005272 [Rozella allomycis CSF55]